MQKLVQRVSITLSLLILSVGVAGYGLFRLFLLPVDLKNQTPVRVIIPRGKGASWIGNALEDAGLIRSKYVFRFVVWKQGLTKSIQSGTYSLSKAQSLTEIAQTLTKGTDDVWVTVVEGLRREEVANVFAHSIDTAFDTKEFLTLTKGKEGYLFPDTYLIPKDATTQLTATLLTNTFARKVTPAIRAGWKAQELSELEALTLASLVQREARDPASMKMVAGILLKRLRADWPLQVDATLQYIKGFDANENTWWPTPLAVDKKLKSPYNTYLHVGLPPGPIANPGLDTMDAVAFPTENEFWYYLTGRTGEMHYAKTIEEHNANITKYL